MAYDGNGVFNRIYNWEADAAAGINILAQRMDEEMNGFATGLSQVLTRDGQAGMLAPLDMGNFRITGLGDATAEGDAISRKIGDGRYLRVAGNTLEGPLKIKQGTTGQPTDPMLQFLNVAGTPRWAVARDEANGQLNIIRLNDAGVVQGSQLSFLTNGRVKTTGSIIVDEAGGGGAFLLQNGSGVDRWAFAHDTGTGDLLVARFGTDGVFQDSPIRIAQSNGNISLQKSTSVTGIFTVVGSGQGWAYVRTPTNLECGFVSQDSQNSDRMRLFYQPSTNQAWIQCLDWAGNGNSLFQSLQLDGNGMRIQTGHYRGPLPSNGASLQTRTPNTCSFDWQSPNARIFIDTTAIVIGTTSDRRVKRVIGGLNDAIETIKKLNPIRYFPKVAEGFDNMLADETVEQHGLIADEVQNVIPSIVSGTPDDPEALQSVYYAGLVPLLIAAVQELTGRIEQLEQGV